jgi:hypothetical protein
VNNYYGPNCQYVQLNSTTFVNSTILSQEQGIALMSLIGIPSNTKLTKLYAGSINGFGASNFHSNCDGFYGTLTIVKSSNLNV